MGLAISRTIVEAHHGRLSVGAPGVRARHHGAIGPAARFRARSGRAIDMTAEPTVFVVDDNPGVRKSLQALVEAAGLAVETYASAAEFLEAYDAQRPGCLVLDVRLRGGERSGSAGRAPPAERDAAHHRDDRLRRRAHLRAGVQGRRHRLPAEARAAEAADRAHPRGPRRRSAHARRGGATRRRGGPHRPAHAARARGHGAAGRREAAPRRSPRRCSISVRTVESHRRTVLRKMDVSSAAQLARAVAGIQLP